VSKRKRHGPERVIAKPRHAANERLFVLSKDPLERNDVAGREKLRQLGDGEH